MRSWLLGFGAAIIATAAAAQEGGSRDEIVVTGKKKEVVQALKQIIQEGRGQQLARFEKPICPAVRGLPSDWGARVERMIRENVMAAGGKTLPAGCQVNALTIFVGEPHDLLVRLNKDEPSFFGMQPRVFERFALPGRAAYSWQLSETFGSRGQILRNLGTLTYQDPNTVAIVTTTLDPGTKLASDETDSRLKTGVREEIAVSFTVIDRDRAEGKTLRQLADFATLHLMLDIKEGAEATDPDSILALFEQRSGWVPPSRMSNFDRGALSGFYKQKYNNRSAVQQRENIAAAMRREARRETPE